MDSFSISLPQSSRVLAITMSADERGHQSLTDLSQLMSELGRLGIYGPFFHNLDRDGTLIGSGAQFDVYKTLRHNSAVYKRIKLSNSSSSLSKAIERRVHLRAIQLEIASLCDPVRRTNPNIVRLHSWGFDHPNGDRSSAVPVLAVERAICSLETALRNGTIETAGRKASSIHHHLCLDIASGLQAIHHSGLAHGDLKPSNVLIFAQKYPDVPFIAKLSDFGQCIVLKNSISAYRSYRGTPGWLPPEITSINSDVSAIEPHLLAKCDAYTYGLLTMSVFLNRGESLASCTKGSNEPLSAQCYSQIEKLRLVENLSQKLKDLAVNELASTPQTRRNIGPDLLQCNTESFYNWSTSRRYFQDIKTPGSGFIPLNNDHSGRSLNRVVLDELESQFEDPVLRSNFNHTTLFGMASYLLRRGGIDVHARAAAYFLEAARCSYIPAQAIMQRILQAVPNFTSKVSEDEIKKWLFNGARTGSLVAIEDLRRIDPYQADQAREEFVRDGGYNQNMSFVYLEPFQSLASSPESIYPSDLLNSRLDNAGNRPLHYAAAFGDTATLSFLLRLGAQINAVNNNGETALYKACLAGNACVVSVLADFCADARIGISNYSVSCLHWLFNFDEDKQLKISHLLVDMGADITSCSQEFQRKYSTDSTDRHLQTQFLESFHFPFRWPLGTPLHWATFARRPSTCDILLGLGSNIDRLYVSRHLTYNTAYTSLSIAASKGDSLMIGHLLSRKANPSQLKRQDRGVIHLLAQRALGFQPLKWWVRHGSWEAHLSELIKCVKLLSSAGVDLNTSAITPIISFTPIEAAVMRELNGGALIALLKAGAQASCSALHQHNSLLSVWCSKQGGYILSYKKEFKETFESILEYTGDCIGDKDNGKSILHVLSGGGSDPNFKYLASRILSRAPDLLETTDNFGRTPLLLAAETCSTIDYHSDSKTKPEMLLDLNANILAKSSSGVGFLQAICSNDALLDSACIKLAQRYLRAMDSNIETMSYELENSLRSASATLKPQVVKLLTPLVRDINSPGLRGLNSFDFALRSAHDLRLQKLDEWLDRRIVSLDQPNGRCYITRLQAGPEILESTSDFLKDEKAVERLFDNPWDPDAVADRARGVQRLDVERYFGCIDILKTLKSAGAVKSHSVCYFGIRATKVRQPAIPGYNKGLCYKFCPKDKREPFWVGHWEVLAEHSCSCRVSDFVSVIWTLVITCWRKEEGSVLSIRELLLCAGFASLFVFFSSVVPVSIDELFRHHEKNTEDSDTWEISEVEHLKVRWIRVVGRMEDENDVQLELGATLFDPTAKDFKGPEPPPLKIEARGLRYTLPASHLNWACITPSWIGRIPQLTFPEGGTQLSELQKRRLKHNKVSQTREHEHPAIFDYLERFRWPQG